MNIQEAKEEIKRTLKAYLFLPLTVSYCIPPNCQRPILLMGPPNIRKRPLWNRLQKNATLAWSLYYDPSYPSKCHRSSFIREVKLSTEKIFLAIEYIR